MRGSAHFPGCGGQAEPERPGSGLFRAGGQPVHPYGDTKKGYRPSFIKAAKPPLSVDAYELFLAEMAKHGLKDVQHGEFGAHMQVSLVNEGPCTIIIDTDEWKKKE